MNMNDEYYAWPTMDKMLKRDGDLILYAAIRRVCRFAGRDQRERESREEAATILCDLHESLLMPSQPRLTNKPVLVPVGSPLKF